MRIWGGLGVTLLIGLLAAPVKAQSDSFKTGREEARSDLVVSLEELADWCSKEKIYLDRDKVHRTILRFDPEHAESRKVLQHKKDDTGAWIESPKRREPRNFDKDAAKKFPEELRQASRDYCERMFDLATAEESALSHEQRQEAFDEILFFDPDHAGIHELRGEVLHEGQWVLSETPRAKERRAQIKEIVREGYRNAPNPEKSTANDREKAFSIPWRGVYANDLVRVLGTGEDKEMMLAARAVQAADHVLGQLYGGKGRFHEQFTVFLLANPSLKSTFLDAHPTVKGDYRKQLGTLEGSGIQGTGDFVHWTEGAPGRIDATVRFCLSWWTESAFGVNWEHGWIYEGFGLYLTRELVGTRLNWFVQPSQLLEASAENELRARLLHPDTNWIDEGYQVLQRPDHPSYTQVVRLSVNQLTPETLLMSYVLAAYLLEARPESVPDLFQRLKKGEPDAQALQAALGMDTDNLARRIRRWLSERR